MKQVLKFMSLALVTSFFWVSESPEAQDRRVIVEDIPSLENIYRVSASQTHSGLPVPRYVSLKFGRVNGRQGPSLKHPVLWQYRRKGLPLVVVAEMDVWRKVRDIHGDESWLRSTALSGTRTVMAREELVMRNKPSDQAGIIAIADANALMELGECNSNNWCKIQSSQGYKGWAKRDLLWGAGPL